MREAEKAQGKRRNSAARNACDSREQLIGGVSNGEEARHHGTSADAEHHVEVVHAAIRETVVDALEHAHLEVDAGNTAAGCADRGLTDVSRRGEVNRVGENSLTERRIAGPSGQTRLEVLPQHMANSDGAELDDQIVQATRVRARNQDDNAMKAVALLHVFGVVERSKKFSHVGGAALELVAPAKIDEEQVHVRGTQGVRRSSGIPDRDELHLVTSTAQHRVELGGQAAGSRSAGHVGDQRLERLDARSYVEDAPTLAAGLVLTGRVPGHGPSVTWVGEAWRRTNSALTRFRGSASAGAPAGRRIPRLSGAARRACSAPSRGYGAAQKNLMLMSISFCLSALYGAVSKSSAVNGVTCLRTPLAFENASNPKKPCPLPMPLLLEPPNGR